MSYLFPVPKVPKFGPDLRKICSAFHRADTEIGQISANFERGRFEIGLTLFKISQQCMEVGQRVWRTAGNEQIYRD